jgi:putative flippase GtrA
MNGTAWRFLCCGGAAALVNWVARFALADVFSFPVAVVLAYAVGMLAGFTLYRGIVWPVSGKPWHEQIVAFVAVNLAGAAVVLISALALVQVGSMLGVRGSLVDACSHALAIAIGAAFNYFGHSRITFGLAKR